MSKTPVLANKSIDVGLVRKAHKYIPNKATLMDVDTELNKMPDGRELVFLVITYKHNGELCRAKIKHAWN